jgi:hypothetical protein
MTLGKLCEIHVRGANVALLGSLKAEEKRHDKPLPSDSKRYDLRSRSSWLRSGAERLISPPISRLRRWPVGIVGVTRVRSSLVCAAQESWVLSRKIPNTVNAPGSFATLATDLGGFFMHRRSLV